jgi:hypothetical protein
VAVGMAGSRHKLRSVSRWCRRGRRPRPGAARVVTPGASTLADARASAPAGSRPPIGQPPRRLIWLAPLAVGTAAALALVFAQRADDREPAAAVATPGRRHGRRPPVFAPPIAPTPTGGPGGATLAVPAPGRSQDSAAPARPGPARGPSPSPIRPAAAAARGGAAAPVPSGPGAGRARGPRAGRARAGRAPAGRPHLAGDGPLPRGHPPNTPRPCAWSRQRERRRGPRAGPIEDQVDFSRTAAWRRGTIADA